MELLDRITKNPGICHGKPTVRGLRYTVESMLELMASGMTHQQILEDYEDLEQEDLGLPARNSLAANRRCQR